jgi:hypothetical protein
MSEWSAQRFLSWAGSIGTETREVVSCILQEKRHEQQSFRRVLALLSNAKKYGRERLNKGVRSRPNVPSPVVIKLS